MKVDKEIISNNFCNQNKNFIPKPRPLSKRDDKMNLLFFNRPHKNNLNKICEMEQIEFNNHIIKFNKRKRPKSQKEELKEIKFPKINLRNKSKKNLIKKKVHKIKIKIKIKMDQKYKTENLAEKIKRIKPKINSDLSNQNIENNMNYNKYIKEYFKCENQNSKFKKEMEDIAYANINFIENKNHSISLFAIFDGHNGKFVSEYLNENLPKILYSQIEKNEYQIEKSINETFEEINKNLETIPNAKEIGSTATIIIIDNNILYCANVGDSQCYYITKDKIIQMTKLHNCKNKEEIERVKKNKGLVFQNRVFGSLSLTRSIGDTYFKEFGVSGIPDITKEILSENYSKFIILGSDGVWDVIKESYLNEIEKENGILNAKDFCEKIVSSSIQKGSKDNISCIVIKL